MSWVYYRLFSYRFLVWILDLFFLSVLAATFITVIASIQRRRSLNWALIALLSYLRKLMVLYHTIDQHLWGLTFPRCCSISPRGFSNSNSYNSWSLFNFLNVWGWDFFLKDKISLRYLVFIQLLILSKIFILLWLSMGFAFFFNVFFNLFFTLLNDFFSDFFFYLFFDFLFDFLFAFFITYWVS